MDEKKLLEQQGMAALAMEDVRSRAGDSMTAEQHAEFNKAYDDYTSARNHLEALRRLKEVQDEQARRKDFTLDLTGQPAAQNAISEELRTLAFNGFIRSQITGEVRKDEADAISRCGINPQAKELSMALCRTAPKSLAEVRGMTVGTPAAGGYTVPTGFSNALEEALLAYAPMREISSIMRTTSGNDLPYPTVNDTGNSAVQVNEEGDTTGGAIPAFGSVIFKAFKNTSGIIPISAELLQDSYFDMAAYLGRAIGDRLGRKMNTDFTVGVGTTAPKGIVTAATAFETAVASTLTLDDVLALTYAVDGAYRRNGMFMANDQIILALSKFKDDNGQYLWQPSRQAGQPDMLNGYAIMSNNDMASAVADGAKIITFGDMSKYMIREVGQIRIKRLVELLAGNDQEGFVGYMRYDGNLLDAGTHPVKVLTVKSA